MQFTFLFTSSCSFFPPFSWRIWVPDTSCPQENVVRIMCIFRRMMPSPHSRSPPHCTGFKKWGSSPGVTDGSGAQQISLLTPSLEPLPSSRDLCMCHVTAPGAARSAQPWAALTMAIFYLKYRCFLKKQFQYITIKYMTRAIQSSKTLNSAPQLRCFTQITSFQTHVFSVKFSP